MDQQLRQGAEVSRRVAVLGRIADIVLRRVAGVDHPAAVGQVLRDRIEGRHADPGRHIDLRLAGHLGLPADLLEFFILLERLLQGIRRRPDIDGHIGNPERVHQELAVGDIRLHAARHQHAHDAVLPERLRAESRGHTGVLAARDADHGAAGRAVLREIITNPLDDLVFCLLRIFQHNNLPGDVSLYFIQLWLRFAILRNLLKSIPRFRTISDTKVQGNGKSVRICCRDVSAELLR